MTSEPQTQEKSSSEKPLRSRVRFLPRNPLLEFRELGELIRYEFKRIIFSQKFFIALSLILLPAILYLDSIASQVEVILLDIGKENFMKRGSAGFVILGQFLMQMIAIMLTLDSYGKSGNESLKRYFAMPIRKSNVFFCTNDNHLSWDNNNRNISDSNFHINNVDLDWCRLDLPFDFKIISLDFLWRISSNYDNHILYLICSIFEYFQFTCYCSDTFPLLYSPLRCLFYCTI